MVCHVHPVYLEKREKPIYKKGEYANLSKMALDYLMEYLNTQIQ